MNTDVALIAAVACLSAFVMLHVDEIGRWISRQLARLGQRDRSVSRSWVQEHKQAESKVIPFEGIAWKRPFDRVRDYSSEPRDAA